MSVFITGVTALIALAFAVALLDQWRVRRQSFQLAWAVGMLFFGIASACEAIAAASGWNETLYRTWYLTGAVWTAGWLGLGTAFLLGRTRFGYAFAFCLFLAGLFTFLTQQRYNYAGAGSSPILYFIAAGILAIAVAVATYFGDDRWPRIAALAAVRVPGAPGRAPAQPRPRHHPDRDRGLPGLLGRHARAVRRHGVLRLRQAAVGGLPVRGFPGERRGVQRRQDPVHG